MTTSDPISPTWRRAAEDLERHERQDERDRPVQVTEPADEKLDEPRPRNANAFAVQITSGLRRGGARCPGS
jgi:hypothetical protein